MDTLFIANFAMTDSSKFSLNVIINGNGSVSPIITTKLPCDTTIILTATPGNC